MKLEQPTMQDIADRLGVSRSTVSRALKDHPDISPKTKKAVQQLARELDFEPNAIALSFRQNRTNTVGVIIPDVVHHFFSTVISGIQEIAYSKGINVMICQTNESYDREVKDVQALYRSRVDGLLVSVAKSTDNLDHFIGLQKRGVPLVFFDRSPDLDNVSCVLSKDFEGAYKATKHLGQQGCKRIAHMAGPENLRISKERVRGYQQALKDLGLPAYPELIIHCGDGTQEGGAAAAIHLIDLPLQPDAIFANNDLAAIGAMSAIKSRGLQIPNDIAVVGYSNWQISSMVEPPLSSIAQPGFEMGSEAMRLFIAELNDTENKHQPVSKYLDTELIIRASSMKNNR